jgi:nucleoside phosphorylase
MIAVTFALPAESSDFISLLQRKSRDREIVSGWLDGEEVRVLHTGVGEKVARARIEEFLSHASPSLLISAGFAGALSDDLRVADLLLAENFSAPELLSRARSILGAAAQIGTLATIGVVVDNAADRADLARRTGAAAVDMETECIAQTCSGRSVPLISLRTISDTPAAPLPAPPHVLFNIAKQRTSYPSLALHITRNPGAILKLTRFAKQITATRASLTQALQTLIKTLPLEARL